MPSMKRKNAVEHTRRQIAAREGVAAIESDVAAPAQKLARKPKSKK